MSDKAVVPDLADAEEIVAGERVEEKIIRRYEYDSILEMLGGYSHFEREQIDYVYHKLNGNVEQAEYFLNICLEKAQLLKENFSKLKTPEEIDALTKQIENLESTDVEK
jgi:hypothetical protein